MRTPRYSLGAVSGVSKVAVLAAALLLVANVSDARGSNDHGSRGVWRSGGERARSGGVEMRGQGGHGGEARWKSGGPARGGGASYGGDARWKHDGGRGGGPAYSGDVRWKHDGGRIRGGGPAWGGGSPRGFARDRHDHFRGPRYTGPRYGHGGWYPYAGYYHRDPRPRTYVSIGLGLPYYCPVRYRRVVVRHPVVREYGVAVSVDNLPPAGCYYYDPYCDREFADLDSYTDHVDGQSHSPLVEIRDLDTGDCVRTLEFAGGYWVVRR